MKNYYKISKVRKITRRSVLWLGLICNLKCKFCYDAKLDNNKSWLPFEEATIALKKFKYFYNNLFVDFMGGEPTLYPEILKLIEFSSKIGLKPTCITNAVGINSKSILKSYQYAGINDFLISIHAIGDLEKKIHNTHFDSYKKQIRAIELMNELGIPFRINTIVIRDNLEQLEEIAHLTATLKGRVLNFITFNPYFEWSTINKIDFQPKFSLAVNYLKKAIDVCKKNEVEVNVRYLPLCQLPGCEKQIFNNFQLPYDCHEWDFNSWFDKGLEPPLSEEWYYNQSNNIRTDRGYVHTKKCMHCKMKMICDGIHIQYMNRWGDDELSPLEGELIKDPTFFIKNQAKVEYNLEETRNDINVNSNLNLSSSQFNKKQNNRAGITN